MQTEQTPEQRFLNRVSKVLGPERVSALSTRQDKMLSQAYFRRLKGDPEGQISDAEILGQYELVVEHTSPIAYEVLPKR
jgi:hypothetical protein